MKERKLARKNRKASDYSLLNHRSVHSRHHSRGKSKGILDYNQYEPRVLLSANDPPVNFVPQEAFTTVNLPVAFTAYRGNQISTSDPDAGQNSVEVTLTAQHGTVTLVYPDPNNGLSYTSGDGEADITMTFVGKLEDLNAAMEWVSFNPDIGYVGSEASLTITTNDRGYFGTGGPQEDVDTINIDVTEVPAFDPPPTWTTLPGALDTSFDDDGKMILSLSEGVDRIHYMNRLPEGKILAVGAVNDHFGLMRFNADMTLDESFGEGGFTETNLGDGNHALTFEIDRQERIVVGGEGFIARYLPNGTLDATFGDAGVTENPFFHKGFSIAIQANGKIAIAGGDDSHQDDTFQAIRLNADGVHEPEFNTSIDMGQWTRKNDKAREIIVRDNGLIIIAGKTYNLPQFGSINEHRFGHAFVPVEGKFDEGPGDNDEFAFVVGTEGGGGNPGPWHQVRSSYTLPDGGWLLVGHINGQCGLTKHLYNGDLDPAFGEGGIVRFDFDNIGSFSFGAVLQSDGKLVVSGYTEDGGPRMTVTRFTHNGELDPSFNATGKLVIPDFETGDTLLVQEDGKILVAGRTGDDIALVRLYGDYDIFGDVPNDPTLDPIDDTAVIQDSGNKTVVLTGITDGDEDEEQALRVTAVSSNTNLIPSPTVTYVSPDSNGTLSFTPAEGQFGTATVTVTVEDWGANGKFASGTFEDSINYATGLTGRDMDLSDLDGDGELDAVISDADSDKIAVLMGQGDGTFGSATTYTVGENPYAVVIGDFDEDGSLDVATANSFTDDVTVLFGLGDGSFGASLTFAAGNNPEHLDVGDINDDGHLDLIVANDDGNAVSVLTGNGDGTFNAANVFDLGNNSRPSHVLVSDLDKDGALDIVTSNTNSHTLGVLLGNNDGTFSELATYGVSDNPFGAAVGDFNNDGNLDLAATSWGSSSRISILLGNGDGTFGAATNLSAGPALYRVAVADFDLDGNDDLAVSNSYQQDTISLLMGNGDGTFGSVQQLPVAEEPNSVLIADVNHDGIDDILTSTNDNSKSLSVLLGIADDDNQTFSRTFTVKVKEIVNVGDVDYYIDSNANIDNEEWYEGTATTDGFLSIGADFDQADGDVQIELLDDQKNLIATGSSIETGQRIDYDATAGEQFYVRLLGDNSNVDVRMLNLVSESGDTVNVGGTAGADSYTLAAGANHRVVVHGFDYQFASADYQAFLFDGGDGWDTIWLGGTSHHETVVLRLDDTQVTGSGYTAQALNIDDVTFVGRGGTDEATFHDTNKADSFTSGPSWSKLEGEGYQHIVRSIPNVTAHASIGYDLAFMRDTSGNDSYETFSGRVVMTSDTHVATAIGFKRSSGTSSGGNDTATAYDSNGNDRLISYNDRVILFDGSHTHASIGFANNQVEGSGQAGDVAYMFDSAGDDQVVMRPESTVITQSDRQTTAEGFSQTFVYASDGNDTVEFHDTAGDNDYNGYLDRGVMKGEGIFLWGRGFDQMTGYFSGGTDRALMFDSPGDDTYVSRPSDATMSNDAASNRVFGFDSIFAFSDAGNDTATLYDTPGEESFRAYSDRAIMRGEDLFSWAGRFAQVTAHSAGGSDIAYLYDSPGNDTFRSEGASAQMAGAGFLNQSVGFLNNFGYSSGGNDMALMYDTPGNDLYRTYPQEVTMTGQGITNIAYQFEHTHGYSTAGSDSARMFDSAGDDEVWSYSDWLEMIGDGWDNEVIGFQQNTIYGSGGFDQATMEDSSGDDLIKVREIGPRLTQGDGTVFDVRTFDRILARSVNGGDDVADLLDVDYEFELEGDWNS